MFKLGDLLKIKDSDKEELIARYESSGGMSGIPRKEIDYTYVYQGMDGSNIIAKWQLDKSVIISLNHSRFEYVQK